MATTKRNRSETSTPSPLASRAHKSGRFEVLQPEFHTEDILDKE